MAKTIESNEWLFTHLRAKAIVITPNNRLSQQLLQDFFKHSPATTQDKPHCLPYQTFLYTYFKQIRHRQPHVKHPIVLNPQPQFHLWRKIISNKAYSIDQTSALQHAPTGLIQAVQEAWTRCQFWQIDNQHPTFAYTAQTRQFQHWQAKFQQHLTKLEAITEEQLADYIIPYLSCCHLTPIIWACFDDYTPQQHTLQKHLLALNSPQYHFDLLAKPTTITQYAAKDSDDETIQIIQWLKASLAKGEKRIAVVIPDLQTQSRALQRQLTRHLAEDQFNISLGQPFATYPLVAHALAYLNLEDDVISNFSGQLLLRSPYLCGAKTEMLQRAHMLQESKILREEVILFADFIEECKRLSPVLGDKLSTLSTYPLQATPAEWVTFFKTRLGHLGFPGEYALNTATYQCYQRFLALCDEFLQLALLSPIMPQHEALACLQNLAQNTIFQVHKATAPIQILGLLEASGCTFDGIWIARLTDQCLPQKVSLSAFIPLELQRTHAMPHANPIRELYFAKQLLNRLQYSSHHCVLSYPQLLGDIPNLPSPLITGFPPFHQLPAPPYSPTALKSDDEDYTIPFTHLETISGGTALLANQAKCPFRAFAAHRLQAKVGQKTSMGLDAIERGQLIHMVLDKLWKKIKTQENLVTLSSNRIDQHIEEAILAALTPFITYRHHSFTLLIQEIEAARLKVLVHACLTWEKNRPEFSVAATEQAFTIHLAGIDFHVRVDRLDKIGNKQWVIDYKSSLPTNPWYEERPEDPQLLLYALLDDTINALLFIQLKAGRVICSGLSEESLPIKGLTALKKETSWADYRQQWHDRLSKLAHEFRSGHCPPTPNRESICQQCDFPSLCRIER